MRLSVVDGEGKDMKKAIIVLALILAITGAALSLLDGGGEYAAERLFYRALKNSSKILMNPDVAPPAMIANVENDLTKILAKYPRTNMIKTARLTLAEFYIDTKRYAKALSTLDEIINRHKDNPVMSSKAQFLKGLVYERQDKWDKALKEYTTLREEYTETVLGLQIPLYIGRYYFKNQMQEEADNTYKNAALFYRKLEAKNRGKPLGYAVSKLLIQVYANLKQYEEAGRVVESTIGNYPLALTFQQQLPNVELIFVKILNRPEKAIEIFNNVKDKVKEPKLREFLEKKIEGFKAKKS